MKIGFRISSPNSRGGGGQYNAALLRRFAEIYPENEYYLYTPRLCDDEFSSKYPNFHKRTFFIPMRYLSTRMLWEQVVRPSWIALDGLDLVHLTELGMPIYPPTKYVVTIHDTHHKILPHLFPKPYRIYWDKVVIPSIIKKASRVITDSENSKKDIVNHFGIREDKIVVIPLGVEDYFVPIKDRDLIESAKKKYGISGKYILGVGAFDKRKNTTKLIEVFLSLKREDRISSQFQLVIVGYKSGADDMYNQYTEQIGTDILLPGYIRNEQLPPLYSGAKLFVFPSLYEGFGIPPLEALACGTSVITSNVSSLPEVVGDAGILVNPHSEREIANAIIEMLNNDELQNELSAKGIKRAEKFRWNEIAKKTMQVYEEVHRSLKSCLNP